MKRAKKQCDPNREESAINEDEDGDGDEKPV
jgi:hypothetical protein